MSENPLEESFRSAINADEKGVLAIDSDIRTKYVNQKMAGVLGYSADLMIGIPLFEFMDEEGQKSLNGVILSAGSNKNKPPLSGRFVF